MSFSQGGHGVMAYELVLENRGENPVTLTSVDVQVAGRVEALRDTALSALAMQVSPDSARASGLRRDPATVPITVPPHGRLVLFFWHVSDTPPSGAAEHVLTTVSQGQTSTLRYVVPAAQATASTLRAPVEGPGWFVHNAPSNDSPHRRSVYESAQGWRIGQRYALDLVRVDETGRRTKATPRTNADFVGYGVPVVAVADGTVAAVRDGIPENELRCQQGEPLRCESNPAVNLTPDTVGGNAVILDIGSGRYAVYAHLVPGAMLVSVGQQVRAGQELGRLGNSGHSQEPHLHFHLCDQPSVVACDGLPFHFESFVAMPIDPRTGPTGAPKVVAKEMVQDAHLVHFPDAAGRLPGPPR